MELARADPRSGNRHLVSGPDAILDPWAHSPESANAGTGAKSTRARALAFLSIELQKIANNPAAQILSANILKLAADLVPLGTSYYRNVGVAAVEAVNLAIGAIGRLRASIAADAVESTEFLRSAIGRLTGTLATFRATTGSVFERLRQTAQSVIPPITNLRETLASVARSSAGWPE